MKGETNLSLPSYAPDNYSKTYKPPRGRQLRWDQLRSSPGVRVLLLLLAIAGLYALLGPRAAPAEVDFEPELDFPVDQESGGGQQAGGGSRGTADGQQQQQQQQQRGQQGLEEVPASQLKQQGFNRLLHQMYNDLPALREATPAILTGSWQLNRAVYDYAASHPAAEVLSWEQPRVVLFRSFLSPEEVQYLLDASTPRMVQSDVLRSVGSEGGSAAGKQRASYGAWVPQDPVVQRISSRIHRLTAVPEQFGEGLYVLQYRTLQQYTEHRDHCMVTGSGTADAACAEFLKRAGGPECGPGKGGASCGDRVLTFILYLKHAARGGSTAFPAAGVTKKRLAAAGKEPGTGNAWACSTPEVLAASPRAGDAILFWNYAPGRGRGTGSHLNGTGDPQAQAVPEALHTGCPVLEGEKVIATRWMRATGFDHPRLL